MLLLLLLLSGGIVDIVIDGLLVGIVALGYGGCLLLRWLGHGSVSVKCVVCNTDDDDGVTTYCYVLSN